MNSGVSFSRALTKNPSGAFQVSFNIIPSMLLKKAGGEVMQIDLKNVPVEISSSV